MIYLTARSNPIPGRKEGIQKGRGRGLGQCYERGKILRRQSRERKGKRGEEERRDRKYAKMATML